MAPPTHANTAPAWVQIFPLLLIGIVFAAAVLWLAPRKGRSSWLALLTLIPCGGFLVVLYLLSLTDKRVLDDIDTLKKQIGRQDGDNSKS